jgi:choline dehydrogenase-like flavoprotein
VAKVSWQIRDADYEAIERVSSGVLGSWPAADLGGLRLCPVEACHADSAKPHDAYHPVGICRMGNDDRATVDLDLKVKGTENLFLLSTGIFPSAGTANPTFSMLCFGERLGNRLAGDAASQAAPYQVKVS